MRFFLAGLFCLALSPIAYSQVADGQVEVIGFGNYFRPDAWTPMKIRLRPKSAETGSYKIRIIQQDMNGRRVDYTREISIGRSEGSSQDLFYWAYFIPRPRNNGLAESLSGGALADLREQLTVHLSTVDGKLLDKISLTSGITSLDPERGGFTQARGQKLVLCVGETMPVEPKYESMLGVVEDAVFVRVLPRELPDNVIGYDAVDAVIWMNSDPTTIAEPATLEALRDYVRNGGKFVVSQAGGVVPALIQEQSQRRPSPFTTMLPVTLRSVAERDNLLALQAMAQAPPGARSTDPARRRIDEQNRAINAAYSAAKGPFRLTRADAHPGAIVESWIDWSGDGKDKTPFLVRSIYGLGSVTWIAQDLSDPSLTRAVRPGWAYVWDRVFDWKNDTTIRPATPEETAALGYSLSYGVDFGGSFLGQMDLTSKAAAFVFLAVLFFIAYWIIAGPGAYLMLASKKKAHLSWFMFALSAVVATGLTVLVVQLLLRGSGELRHMSLVRLAPGQPALVSSRFGLYIPEDGAQSLTLTGAAPGTVNYISPYKMHPQHLSSDLAMAGGTPYEVPVPAPLTPAEDSNEPSYTLSVPYRSTIEKFSARWLGDKNGIAADVTLVEAGFISGTMTNATGHALKNVYIGFRYPNAATDGYDDWILYVRDWSKGAALDIGKLFNMSGPVQNNRETRTPILSSDPSGPRPGSTPVVRGRIEGDSGWARYWFEGLSPDFGDLLWNDSDKPVPKSVPMLTFFERLPPSRADQNKQNRFELFRRGARDFDLSHAMAAGGLVVVAESEGALPYPLQVDGEPIEGSGRIYVQAVLPLARDPALDAPDPEDTSVESAPATTRSTE